MSIDVAKLVDGSIVIGNCPNGKGLENVMDISIVPSEKGMQIGLRPYLFPFNDKSGGFKIDEEYILAKVEAEESFKNIYLQAQSGIVIAKNLPKDPPKGLPGNGNVIPLFKK